MADFTGRTQAIVKDFEFKCVMHIWNHGCEFNSIDWVESPVQYTTTVYIYFTHEGNRHHLSQTFPHTDIIVDDLFQLKLKDFEHAFTNFLKVLT